MTYKAMMFIHLLCTHLKDRADIEDNELFYCLNVEDLGLVGCRGPLTCRMQKTLNRFMWGNVLGFY